MPALPQSPPQLSPSPSLSNASPSTAHSSPPAHLHALAQQVSHNLRHQHDWTDLSIVTPSSHDASKTRLQPRPLIRGLPARRIYIHPDEQIEMIKRGLDAEDELKAEAEWVLPTHLKEKWSLRMLAGVFDAIAREDAGAAAGGEERDGRGRVKRVLLAVVSDDSTVVYYIVHDGIVKPRQN